MADIYGENDISLVLQQVASQWMRQLERGKRWKETTYGQDARECMQYFAGPKSWDDLMGTQYIPHDIMPKLGFRMFVNKAYEFVKIFGPSLYYANPVRTCKPRAPVQVPAQFFPDPMQFQMLAQEEQTRVAVDGIRSILLEGYLNWTPSRFQLDMHSRKAVDEALIKGRGLLYTELAESPDGAFTSVVSRWDSVDRLLIDPDATSLDRAKWVARRCIQPVWEVERDYGLPRGTLKGNYESMAVQADIAVDPELQYRRTIGYTSDLLVFYQIWTRMGMGGRIIGTTPSLRTALDETFGDNCYIVVASTCRFPLNLPPSLVNDQSRYDDAVTAGQWPIPFWQDNKWPFSAIDFNVLFDTAWPLPPLMAARGELRFINWVFSFLAGHIRNASRDFVAIQKSLPEEVKSAIIGGRDLELIELEHDHGAISDCIQFLQHPEVNGDIWKYLQAVMDAFDKRMGLSELMYGDAPPTQSRSAAESNIRNQSAGVRPEDMGNQVESWQAEVAGKEAFAARWLLRGHDVEVCMGPLAAQAWDQYVWTEDTREAFHALEYGLEAGSTRKPNKEFAVRQMTEAMQELSPIFTTYAQQTGDYGPLNNLIADFCKSRDLDPHKYQLSAAPLPAMLPSPAGGTPTPEGDLQVPPASGEPQLG